MKNKIIETLCDIIKSDQGLQESISFISLLGSYRENEAIENYSDIDFLFILNDTDSKGTIKLQTLNRLKEINKNLTSIYKLDVSFLTHTVYDFHSYVLVDFLIHYSWGEVFFGNAAAYKSTFAEIIKGKYENDQERKLNMYNSAIHYRFNCIRKYVSVNEHINSNFRQFICKLFIDALIEIADRCLIFNNHYSHSKKQIVMDFQKLDFIKNPDILKTCYEVRLDWNRYKDNIDFLDSFILKAVEGMQQITSDLITEYELFKTNNNI
jgi:hypothetical protein